jgi:redox-sensitive bicupin YhaK (pirin superfamily)
MTTPISCPRSRNSAKVPPELCQTDRLWADTSPPTAAEDRSLVLFDRGEEVTVQAGPDGIRFLLISGKPLQEPVAWYGPIVMNTQEQLQQAYEELREGTFLKK